MVPTKEPLAVRVTFFENTLDVLTDDVGIEFADVTSAKPRRTRKQPYVWDQPCTFPQVVLEPGSHVVLEVVKATEKDKNGQPVVRTCPRCRAVVAAAPRRVDWWLCTVVCGVSCCPTLWMPRLYCIACCPHPPNLFRWASTDCQCTLHWCLQLFRGVRTLCDASWLVSYSLNAPVPDDITEAQPPRDGEYLEFEIKSGIVTGTSHPAVSCTTLHHAEATNAAAWMACVRGWYDQRNRRRLGVRRNGRARRRAMTALMTTTSTTKKRTTARRSWTSSWRCRRTLCSRKAMGLTCTWGAVNSATCVQPHSPHRCCDAALGCRATATSMGRGSCPTTSRCRRSA